MGWVFLWLALAAITQIWLCFRVARSSVALAVGTFFLGGIAAAYTLFKERMGYRLRAIRHVLAPNHLGSSRQPALRVF